MLGGWGAGRGCAQVASCAQRLLEHSLLTELQGVVARTLQGVDMFDQAQLAGVLGHSNPPLDAHPEPSETQTQPQVLLLHDSAASPPCAEYAEGEEGPNKISVGECLCSVGPLRWGCSFACHTAHGGCLNSVICYTFIDVTVNCCHNLSYSLFAQATSQLSMASLTVSSCPAPPAHHPLRGPQVHAHKQLKSPRLAQTPITC